MMNFAYVRNNINNLKYFSNEITQTNILKPLQADRRNLKHNEIENLYESKEEEKKMKPKNVVTIVYANLNIQLSVESFAQ